MGKPLIAFRLDQESYTKIKAIEKTFDTPISDLGRRALRIYLKDFKPGKVIEPLDPKPKKEIA